MSVNKEITVTHNEESSDKQYLTVVNSEGQYSIWPANKTLPAGWNEAGKRGSREECLQYIVQVWNDMRPKSLRNKSFIPVADIAEQLKV
ncbi:MbtH family NRPS accessory protein [Pantoea cypripedii]|uniref:MbtH family protein n=1 Tax=Pantoea cypripedii TaxID=55209 RepID=UPI002FC8777E